MSAHRRILRVQATTLLAAFRLRSTGMEDHSVKSVLSAVRIGIVSWALIVLTGCAAQQRTAALRATGGSAALVGQFRVYDGRTGQPISFERVVAMAANSDVVLFGEEHSDIVCNGIEAQLLSAMSEQQRPVALAMEFFEVDTQAALDDYLNGKLDENEFRKLTRQKKAYLTAHRPLIEYCRETHIPVIAANAPWRLMRALRLSGKTFEEFRATTQPADRELLPVSSELLTGGYYDRFVEAMKDHMTVTPATSQPSTEVSAEEKMLRGYRAQSLWDDTMAESVAGYRADHPDRRIMLVVGKFHVASEGGTMVKVKRLRPNDRILTIVYHGTSSTPLKFDEADRGAGDVVISGIAPPEDSESMKPTPTTSPAGTSPNSKSSS